MKLSVPREVREGERRVAATPDTVRDLINKLGFEVIVEAGAGAAAQLPDAAYEDAGATVISDREAVWSADVVLKVNPPTERPDGSNELDSLRPKTALISVIQPAQNPELLAELAKRGVDTIALDAVPRISRAQKMDVLSSMANIAGYRAVLEAAHHFGRFFGGQITAAGKTPPAKVLVIGAGVAGLAAIAAARGLGAEVRAFDVREAAGEQAESLGAKFLRVEIEESGEGGGGYAKVMSEEFIAAEMELFRQQCDEIDIIITTALIPGRPAPKLILEDMLHRLKPGSVIVDLAAQTGGNCEVTKPGEVIEYEGVTVIGYDDLTSRLPTHASQFFGTNLFHILDELGGSENWHIDMEDEAIRGATVTLDGEVTWPPPKIEPTPIAKKPEGERTPKTTSPNPALRPKTELGDTVEAPYLHRGTWTAIGAIASAGAIAAVGAFAPRTSSATSPSSSSPASSAGRSSGTSAPRYIPR